MTTNPPLKLRASALPLAFLCPGSLRRAGLLIDETHPAATVGSAAHEGLATLVETGRIDWDGVAALALRHGVDEAELRYLLAQGQRLWNEVRASFPNASTEQELSYAAPDGSIVLTGHTDVLGFSADTIHVGDWKTGRKDSDYSEQLRGYCALGLLAHPSVARATAGVLWVRDGEYEHYTMDRDHLGRWLARLGAEVAEWDGTYRVGAHCAHCPRNHDCPAGHALVRRDVAAIADNDLLAQVEDSAALAAMSPEQLVAVLAKADMVVRYAERVRSAIRSHVVRNGDIVGGGKRLTLQREERRSLETLPAFPVLEQAGFGDEEMAEVIDISLSKAEKIAAAKAPKRKGRAAVRELRARLDEAGAIKVSVITKLVVKRA